MRLRSIRRYDVFWASNERAGIEMEFHGYPPLEFWLSNKQFKALNRVLNQMSTTPPESVIAVLDGDRFVWAADISEIDFIEKHFSVNRETLYLEDPHISELKNPTMVEHDDLKN